MTQSNRDRARRALLLVAVLAGANVAAYASAEESVVVGPTPAARNVRAITVVGVGRERGTPDTAEMRIAVEQTGKTAKAASDAAAQASAKVLEALRREVGPDGRVETASFHLTPVYRNDPQRPARDQGPEITGYTATNQVAVRTKRLDAIGTMIDAAIAAGAARIDALSFSVADPAPLQDRALRAAGADAAAQAAAIAASLHVTLRGVVEASTESMEHPMPQAFGVGKMMRAEASIAPTPIEPGEVTAEARLRVTYGID